MTDYKKTAVTLVFTENYTNVLFASEPAGHIFNCIGDEAWRDFCLFFKPSPWAGTVRGDGQVFFMYARGAWKPTGK